MWFDRKTVPSKTKNANVCSQLDMLGVSQNWKNFVETSVRPPIFEIWKNIKSKNLCHLHFNLDLVTCHVRAAGFAAAVGCDLRFNLLFIALKV